MIKAVVFDFGNVLCRLDRPGVNAALAAHSPLSAAEVNALVWGTDLERDSETGRYDSLEFFRRIKEAIRGEALWTYDAFAGEFMKCLVPYPEGEAALLAVHNLGLRTFILSNTSFLHARFMFNREILATIPELHALLIRNKQKLHACFLLRNMELTPFENLNNDRFHRLKHKFLFLQQAQ
jgi:FMN phosphatase YigB (HAD superfamily)